LSAFITLSAHSITFFGSKSQQAFLAILLLGGLLIDIDAVGKHADLYMVHLAGHLFLAPLQTQHGI